MTTCAYSVTVVLLCETRRQQDETVKVSALGNWCREENNVNGFPFFPLLFFNAVIYSEVFVTVNVIQKSFPATFTYYNCHFFIIYKHTHIMCYMYTTSHHFICSKKYNSCKVLNLLNLNVTYGFSAGHYIISILPKLLLLSCTALTVTHIDCNPLDCLWD